jgi:hypothetical protein
VESNRGRGCVFCGGRPVEKEHVFPRWSQPYLAHPAGPGTHRHEVIRGGGATEAQTWRDEPATVEHKCVCRSCNNGWMSRLENTAQPYLLSAMQGHQRTYYREGLTQLATWATKTALVSGCRFKPSTPASLYRDLYENRLPSVGTRVWFGATNLKQLTFLDHRPCRVSVGNKPPDAVNGYATTLAIGHLAFYVFAREADSPPQTEFGGKFAGAWNQIWPIPSDSVTWPPPGGYMGTGDLDAVADTIGQLA